MWRAEARYGNRCLVEGANFLRAADTKGESESPELPSTLSAQKAVPSAAATSSGWAR